MDIINANPDLVKLLLKLEHMPWRLLEETEAETTKCVEAGAREIFHAKMETKRKDAECGRLMTQNESLTVKNVALRTEFSSLKGFIDDVKDHINDTTEFRNCKKAFWATLEVDKEYKSFKLRCEVKNCRCRRWAPGYGPAKGTDES